MVEILYSFRASARLAGADAFHDARLQALQPLYLEAFCAQVLERLAQEVIALEPNVDRLQQALARAHERVRVSHVLAEQEDPPPTQYAAHLGNGLAVVGCRAQREGAHDRVKRRASGLSSWVRRRVRRRAHDGKIVFRACDVTSQPAGSTCYIVGVD